MPPARRNRCQFRVLAKKPTKGGQALFRRIGQTVALPPMQIDVDPVRQIASRVPAIRPATNADRKQIALLVAEGRADRPQFDSDRDLEDVEAHYAAPDGALLVSEDAGSVTAVGGYRRLDNESVELTRLRVVQSHRQNGLGRRMLRALADSAHRNGYKQLVVELNQEMGEARCLVTSEGFDLLRKTELSGTTLYFYKKLL